MSRAKNPNYPLRAKLFGETCDRCARKRNCTFSESPEGAESVCTRLISSGPYLGSYNCESCLRGQPYGHCKFVCCFFVPIRGGIRHTMPVC